MGEKGHLFIKYEIEKNKELMDETVVLLQKDQIVQTLVGDPLKQD